MICSALAGSLSATTDSVNLGSPLPSWSVVTRTRKPLCGIVDASSHRSKILATASTGGKHVAKPTVLRGCSARDGGPTQLRVRQPHRGGHTRGCAIGGGAAAGGGVPAHLPFSGSGV